jgi:hypothetical protein
MTKINPADKYHSMRFWDELFKSREFESLGYIGADVWSNITPKYWYRASAMPGRFLIGLDDWYFRGDHNPCITLLWYGPPRDTKDHLIIEVMPITIVWEFSYPAVWDFRMFLDALRNPRLMLTCVGMSWCSDILEKFFKSAKPAIESVCL